MMRVDRAIQLGVLANRGIDTRAIQSYLGHNNIQHTVRYTKLASAKFSRSLG